ncbi:hypothetical protein EUBDOL_01182 [Amedibacillus dolichus DSM 3991]|uniref:Uncharacterized protein n=1 Tax=Amedibacillus dolichus DSM 3991 TaxID=428127 RepID=A8RBU1_9FIRM|nr:hypothetical protein EUBDOL_01182 [Amedibacillus dolichus DSM 3991]
MGEKAFKCKKEKSFEIIKKYAIIKNVRKTAQIHTPWIHRPVL